MRTNRTQANYFLVLTLFIAGLQACSPPALKAPVLRSAASVVPANGVIELMATPSSGGNIVWTAPDGSTFVGTEWRREHAGQEMSGTYSAKEVVLRSGSRLMGPEGSITIQVKIPDPYFTIDSTAGKRYVFKENGRYRLLVLAEPLGKIPHFNLCLESPCADALPEGKGQGMRCTEDLHGSVYPWENVPVQAGCTITCRTDKGVIILPRRVRDSFEKNMLIWDDDNGFYAAVRVEKIG